MKKILVQKILKMMAKATIKRRNPEVIAITGSVGKTTTKEMVGKMLGKFKKVRFSEKNYNNEIGVPLTIIGGSIEPKRSKILQAGKIGLAWLFSLLTSKNYPEVLVLEFGADHPGDISYLCDFVPISVGILTDVGISHLENFGSKENIAKEKGILLRSLPPESLAVYNADNLKVKEVSEKVSANKLSYGFDKECNLRASDVHYVYKENKKTSELMLNGLGFKLTYQGRLIPVKLDYCVGEGSVYAALAALAAGFYFDLNLIEMTKELRKTRPCPGRMSFLEGIKSTMIIDDTYNSAPASTFAALNTLAELKAQRKIVVMGDMLELGEEEESAHQEVLNESFKIDPDAVLLVGERFKNFSEALTKKQKERTVFFKNSFKAGKFLQDFIQAGDLILIKGSRGMKMEKAVKEIMRYPEKDVIINP